MSLNSPKRILLVDDDSDHLFLTKWMLERGNPKLHIDVAESGEEGLQKLQEESFDCVISDFEMKAGMNGVDFLQSITNRKIKIPFIMISSYNDALIKKLAIQQGANDFITKSNGEEFIKGVINSVEKAIESSKSNGENGFIGKVQKFRVPLGEKRYFNFFEQSPDLCIFVRSDGLTIDEVNGAAVNILGIGSELLVGKEITELIEVRDKKKFMRTLLEVFSGTNLTREIVFVDSRRKRHLMSVSGKAIRLDGTIMGALLCARPMSRAEAI